MWPQTMVHIEAEKEVGGQKEGQDIWDWVKGRTRGKTAGAQLGNTLA